MNQAKFVVFKKGCGWYYELRASNGDILYTSHQFAKRETAKQGIKVLVNLIKGNLPVHFERSPRYE